MSFSIAVLGVSKTSKIDIGVTLEGIYKLRLISEGVIKAVRCKAKTEKVSWRS